MMSGDSLHAHMPCPLIRGHTWEQMGLVPPVWRCLGCPPPPHAVSQWTDPLDLGGKVRLIRTSQEDEH